MSIKEISEAMLMGVWLVFGWINTSFSFASGAVIFYLYRIDKDKQVFSIRYFLVLVLVTLIAGHYFHLLLPHFVIKEYSDVIPALNFVFGLFSKLILDIVLTKEFVKGKIE